MNFHSHHHHDGRPPRCPPQTPNPSFAGSPNRVLFPASVPTLNAGFPVASPYTASYAAASFPYGNTTPSPIASHFSSYGHQSQESLPSEPSAPYNHRALITLGSLFQTSKHTEKVAEILSNGAERIRLRHTVENNGLPAVKVIGDLEGARQESLQIAHAARDCVLADLDRLKSWVAAAEKELQHIDNFESKVNGPFSAFEKDLKLILAGLHLRPKPITMDDLNKRYDIKEMDLAHAPLEQIRSLVWCSSFECVKETKLDEAYAILKFLDDKGAIRNPSIQAQLVEYHRNGVIANGLKLVSIRCDTKHNLAMRQGLIAIYLGLVPAEAEYRGFFFERDHRGHPNYNPWTSTNALTSTARPRSTPNHTIERPPAAGASAQQASNNSRATSPSGSAYVESTNSTRADQTQPAFPCASGASSREAAFFASGAPTPQASDKRSATSATTTAPFLFSASGTASTDTRSATSASGPGAVQSDMTSLFTFADFANAAPTEGATGPFDFTEMTLPNGQDSSFFFEQTPPNEPNKIDSKVADNVEASTADSTTEADDVAQAPSATEAANDEFLPSVEASRKIKNAFAVPKRMSKRNRRAPPDRNS